LSQVGEGLELECVTCGIQKEHGRLLTNLAFKAGVGLDDEVHASSANPLGKLLPLLLREHDAEVRNGHIMTIHGVAIKIHSVAWCGARLVVRDNLMTKEIEVDPVFCAAAFWTPQNSAVEVTRCVEVVDWKGDVKRSQDHA